MWRLRLTDSVVLVANSQAAKEPLMNGFHPTVTATIAAEHLNDLLRAASRSHLIADLPGRDRHPSPQHKAPWWSRTTSYVAR
jgi:hypothetical protein